MMFPKFLPVELSSLCKGQYPTKMHRKIDAAVIVSKNDKNLDCTVTFTAEYVSQRFLIRFDEFNMDCGDRLFIYDSANDVGSHRVRQIFFTVIQCLHHHHHHPLIHFFQFPYYKLLSSHSQQSNFAWPCYSSLE